MVSLCICCLFGLFLDGMLVHVYGGELGFGWDDGMICDVDGNVVMDPVTFEWIV